MIPYNIYPYTNFHALNADWILAEIKRLQDLIDQSNLEGLLPKPVEGDDGKIATVIAGAWVGSDLYPQKISRLEGDNLTIKGDITAINIRLQEIYDGISQATAMLNSINRQVV